MLLIEQVFKLRSIKQMPALGFVWISDTYVRLMEFWTMHEQEESTTSRY
jgi:hypothetical protein